MPPLKTSPVCSRRRVKLSLVLAVAAILTSQPKVCAELLVWNANPGSDDVEDGSGIWNNLNLFNWWDGESNVQWRSSVPDSAVFGSGNGSAGIVTLGSNITVDDLTFEPTAGGNYTIVGAGHTLTLHGTSIFGTASATLNVNLAGTSGLAVHNAATIRLGGTNTYSGPTFVFGGTLQLDSPGALGNSSQIVVGNFGGVSASSLLINVPDSVSTGVGAGKLISLVGTGANGFGALRGADGASNTWAGSINIAVLGSRISGGDSGTLNITGEISGANTSPVLFSTNRNSTTVLSAVNKYTGDTRLFNNFPGTTSTLKIGVDNAINRNSRLTVISNPSAGAQVVDLNGHVLTFRSLDTSPTTTSASAANLIVTNNSPTPATLTVGDITPFSNAFGGSLNDGTGTLSLVKEGENVQILGGPNTYTGTTTVNGGILQLGGFPSVQGNNHFVGQNAVLASTQYILNDGEFVVHNLGVGNRNDARLPDTADIIFRGGKFRFLGTEAIGQNSSETVRNLILSSGKTAEIRVSFGRVNAATFNANQLTRPLSGPTALIGGDGLGRDGTSTVNVVRFFVNTAPTLVGTTAALPSGRNVNAQNTVIVPFLLGEASLNSGVGTSEGTPNTFITYQAATGFRPLSPLDEFTNNAIVGSSNTRITTGTTAAVNASINSLVMHGGNLAISQTLTNTSGAILFVNGDTISGGTLNFGNVEGLITVNSGKTGIISSRINANSIVTINGPGSLELANPNNAYSGGVVLRSGTLSLPMSTNGNPGAVSSGPTGTGTLMLAGGSLRSSDGTSVNIGNNILFQENSAIAAEGGALTLSGTVTLTSGSRTLANNTDGVANITTFTGTIRDSGQGFGLTINGVGTSPIVLAGANTYTGSTQVRSSTLIVSGSLSGASTTIVGDPSDPSKGARLGGSGGLGDVIVVGSGSAATSGATVDPGNSTNVAGIMKTNAFSLTNGAHLSLQIGGLTPGGESSTGHDQLVATEAVTLTGGDLKLTLIGAPGITVGTQLFLVVNNSSFGITGTFATLNGAAFNPSSFVMAGQQFRLAYNGNFSGPGSDGIANDVVLVAIPEPSLAVALLIAAGLIGIRRRRSK